MITAIKDDLKTIIFTGWHHTLIPDQYLVDAFFRPEADVIDALEASIGEAQGELAEAVDAAQEVAAYEPEEDETVSAPVIKKALKALIDDLIGTTGTSAEKERKALEAQQDAIIAIEKRIKDGKSKMKALTDELEHKLELKRVGGDDFTAETKELMVQVDAQLAVLDENKKSEKRKVTVLNKDRKALQARLDKVDATLAGIGGVLTEEEAKTLVLKKLYDVASRELNRYLSAEERVATQAAENLWKKYALSGKWLEEQRVVALGALNDFLSGLGYSM